MLQVLCLDQGVGRSVMMGSEMGVPVGILPCAEFRTRQ